MSREITFEDKETDSGFIFFAQNYTACKGWMGSYTPISTYFKAHTLFRASLQPY